MAGTECVWDFVSDDSQLLPFLKQIRRTDHTIRHFELVLGTNNRNSSAVKNTILAWRTSNQSEHLLVPQRSLRIDSGCAERWNPAGDKRNNRQEQWHHRERDRVVGTDSVKKAAQ